MRPVVEPNALFLGRRRRGVALRQKLVELVAGLRRRLDDEPAIVDGKADRRPGAQFQKVKDRRRHRQHDRTADFAQNGGVHHGSHLMLYEDLTHDLPTAIFGAWNSLSAEVRPTSALVARIPVIGVKHGEQNKVQDASSST